jgi:hypothetical protein
MAESIRLLRTAHWDAESLEHCALVSGGEGLRSRLVGRIERLTGSPDRVPSPVPRAHQVIGDEDMDAGEYLLAEPHTLLALSPDHPRQDAQAVFGEERGQLAQNVID